MGADVIVTLKVMPESPAVDLPVLQQSVEQTIKDKKGRIAKTEFEPVAFGLKAVKVTFVRDEALGGTDDIEEILAKIQGVVSVQVTNVMRALG